MEGCLRIPLSRVPDEGLDLDVEIETPELGLEDSSWPPLRDVKLAGRLERTAPSQAVFRGTAQGIFRLQCSLGLAEFDYPVTESVVVYFMPRPAVTGAQVEEDVELGEADLEVAFLDDEILDLGPPLRDQLGLAIPLQPKCLEKCLGEDPELCRRLEAGEGVGGEQGADPRWSALREWRK